MSRYDWRLEEMCPGGFQLVPTNGEGGGKVPFSEQPESYEKQVKHLNALKRRFAELQKEKVSE